MTTTERHKRNYARYQYCVVSIAQNMPIYIPLWYYLTFMAVNIIESVALSLCQLFPQWTTFNSYLDCSLSLAVLLLFGVFTGNLVVVAIHKHEWRNIYVHLFQVSNQRVLTLFNSFNSPPEGGEYVIGRVYKNISKKSSVHNF